MWYTITNSTSSTIIQILFQFRSDILLETLSFSFWLLVVVVVVVVVIVMIRSIINIVIGIVIITLMKS